MGRPRALAAMAIVLAWPGAAQAGVYGDDLGKCLVGKTSDTDKAAFARWIFSAMASNASVKDLANVSAGQHAANNKAAADLSSRLMLVDCRAESIAALRYEGKSAIESGFQLFGTVAGQVLVADAEVQKQMQAYTTYLDAAKFAQLARDAGLTPATPAPPK